MEADKTRGNDIYLLVVVKILSKQYLYFSTKMIKIYLVKDGPLPFLVTLMYYIPNIYQAPSLILVLILVTFNFFLI